MSTPVKNPETQVKRPDESLFKRLTRQQLFIPVAALVLLVLFNLIAALLLHGLHQGEQPRQPGAQRQHHLGAGQRL